MCHLAFDDWLPQHLSMLFLVLILSVCSYEHTFKLFFQNNGIKKFNDVVY